MSQTLAEQIAKLEVDVKTYGLTRDKTRLRLLKEKKEKTVATRKPKPQARPSFSKKSKAADD